MIPREEDYAHRDQASQVPPPTHPGEMLLYEFLEPLGMTQTELAKRIGVSYVRVNELVNEKRGMTADTALRLSQLFGNTADFWMNLQLSWDLWHALRSDAVEEIRRIVPLQVLDAPEEGAERAARA